MAHSGCICLFQKLVGFKSLDSGTSILGLPASQDASQSLLAGLKKIRFCTLLITNRCVTKESQSSEDFKGNRVSCQGFQYGHIGPYQLNDHLELRVFGGQQFSKIDE